MAKRVSNIQVGPKKIRAKLVTYDGFPDFAAHMRSQEATAAVKAHADGNWAGANYSDFLERTAIGAPHMVRETERFMGKVSTPVVKAKRKERVMDVTGPVVNVHQAYAGNPMCCIRKRKVISELAPVSIYVDVICSAGVKHEQIIRRGAAVMALVRQLSVVRPVELFAVYGGIPSKENIAVKLRIPTTPLDLSRAAFALVDPSFMRVGMHAASSAIEMPGNGAHRGAWFNHDSKYQVAHFPHDLAVALGAKSENIIACGGLVLGNKEFDSDARAIAWIEKNIAEQER